MTLSTYPVRCVVEWLALLPGVWEVQGSSPAIIRKIHLSFPWSLHAVSGMVSWVRLHPLSSPLFAIHIHSWRLIIWCYVILSADSVVRQIQNKDMLSGMTGFRLGFCTDADLLPQTWPSLLKAQWLLCIPPDWAFEELCFHHTLHFYMLCVFTVNSFYCPIQQ